MPVFLTHRLPILVAAAVFTIACGASGAGEAAPAVGAAPQDAVTAVAHSGDPAVNAPSHPAAATGAAAAPQSVQAIVYKDANCDCCEKWVHHLRDNGFTVISRDVDDLNAVKRRHNLDRSLHSCHTAEIGGYVVEGHVPADLIQKMLRERPPIAGIAVPGMPVGSPGMEWTYKEPYDVIAFTASGSKTIYAKR
jgi:hypothetical protein